MRLFLSIPLPQQCIEELNRVQHELSKHSLFEGSLVPQQNLHITLTFFGSVDDEQAAHIKAQLATISYPATPIMLSELAVNSRSHPHVLWVSVEAPLLELLAELITEKLPDYKQERVFNGHITIARMKQVFDKKLLLSTLNIIPVKPVSWQADHFELTESKTLHEGPVYTTVATYRLV